MEREEGPAIVSRNALGVAWSCTVPLESLLVCCLISIVCCLVE